VDGKLASSENSIKNLMVGVFTAKKLTKKTFMKD